MSVFPTPGSQDVPPDAQIAFRGVNPFGLATVRAIGSVTGEHRGRIAGDSDANGGSFIPEKPFAPGETVSVLSDLALVGTTNGDFQFRVAESPGPVPPSRLQTVARARGAVLRLHSRPDLDPAAIRIIRGAAPPGDDLFLAPEFGPVQNGPMIIDAHGRLVYFKPLPEPDVAADFRVQRFQGQPVLTWWQGYTNAGIGVGRDEIYDSSYHEIAQVQCADGLSADEHEFLLTPAGFAWIVCYYPVQWTSSVKRAKGKLVLDSIVQEIDVKTGLKLFEWHSLDHVPLSDTYNPPGRGILWDYFHVNSIDLDADGNPVISARNTSAAYKIDRSTGSIIWTLGGKHSSFKPGPGVGFAFQHDVRLHGPGDREVSLFDDEGGPPTLARQSRGLRLRLNLRHMRVSLESSYDHSPPLRVRYQGNLQTLPGGATLIGWGQQPYFTEYGPHGRVLLDGRFVVPTSSYRVYALPAWSGTPSDRPAVAAAGRGRTTTVWASWNGSTDTAFWLVLSGTRRGALSVRRLVRRTGYETAILIARARYVRVEALDRRGRLLGSSSPVKSA